MYRNCLWQLFCGKNYLGETVSFDCPAQGCGSENKTRNGGKKKQNRMLNKAQKMYQKYAL